jgi:hypothetical protein
MTFKEFMKEVGYNLLTTFWEDFSIADKYGIVGVKDTYRRAFSEWKDDYKFFTELTLVLNHKIWQHYESNRELAALYDRLWREFEKLDLDTGDATWLHQSYCCDHCVNHWGIGLCGCGSGQKVGKCECGSQKAHDILGVKYDSFGVILKNFG